MKNKKINKAIELIIVLSLFSLIFSGCLDENELGDDNNLLTISINTSQNNTYKIILPVPTGWDNINDYEMESRGQFSITPSKIENQSAFELQGKGIIYIKFFKIHLPPKENRYEGYWNLSDPPFDDSGERGSILIFLNRTEHHSVLIDYLYRYDYGIARSGYFFNTTLDNNGWQDIEMEWRSFY